MPNVIYEIFIKGYTEKQWGVKATELSKDLAVRITINKGTVNTLTPNHRWNALPANGYTEMVRGIIGDIPVKLNFDYLQHRDKVKANKLLIFTGPVDEFFDYKFGKLKYRGQNRNVEYLPEADESSALYTGKLSQPRRPAHSYNRLETPDARRSKANYKRYGVDARNTFYTRRAGAI